MSRSDSLLERALAGLGESRDHMVSADTPLAEGWPARTVRTDVRSVEKGPEPGQGALGGDRWFLVWNRDGFGECCCWRGSVRSDGVGGRGSCQRPGKHPWVTRVDGGTVGFPHGAADALEWAELVSRHGTGGGARQLAVVLDDLLVVDLDGERAVRDFARLAHTVPVERLLGVSQTPRGFHLWLDVPGWNQRALNLWMVQWLGSWGWDPTDPGRAGRRGYLIDVRTGQNRYAVWPGGEAVRRWLSRGEFRNRFVGPVRRALADSWLLPGEAAGRAPWAVDTGNEWLAGWISERSGGAGAIDLGGLQLDGSDSELDATWAELERWLGRLEGMPAGSGRNNRLNQVSYYSGAKAVAAGWSLEAVRARLVQAGEGVGTHGVAATVDSGLRAGLSVLAGQKSAGG